MARDEGTLPEEGLLLCESCGYIVSGLPQDSRCPECGKPIVESSPEFRQPPDWERDDTGRSALRRFWGTTAAVIFHPTRFYRTLATRADRTRSRRFAQWHWVLVTFLLGWTGALHLQWMLTPFGGTERLIALIGLGTGCAGLLLTLLAFLPCCAFAYLSLTGITRLAARLTAWEARYRKLRLPHPVVLRGLDYHSPHYLPVALMAFLTVAGYQLLLVTGILDDLSGPRYLFILCAEVLVAATYLFKTYWAAMRNMMYANR